MTPKEYYQKSTDYSEDGKQLNYIMAYYSLECEANIIIKIGFGTGELKRAHNFDGFGDQQPDFPYILKVGHHWTPKVHYDNPGYFITFPWFKKNVICPDQPWICGGPRKGFKLTRMWWRRVFRKKPDFDFQQHMVM